MTSVLGSVFRAVLTVSRTAFIWAFDITLYYSAWSNGAMRFMLRVVPSTCALLPVL